ncbi:hypothetical protein D3C72_2156750 [compost metagenome]
MAAIQIEQCDIALVTVDPLGDLGGIRHRGDEFHLIRLRGDHLSQAPCHDRQVADQDDVDSGIHTLVPLTADGGVASNPLALWLLFPPSQTSRNVLLLS